MNIQEKEKILLNLKINNNNNNTINKILNYNKKKKKIKQNKLSSLKINKLSCNQNIFIISNNERSLTTNYSFEKNLNLNKQNINN